MLTEKELQRFEERKQDLEKLLMAYKSMNPLSIWFDPVPSCISATRFEELKKLAWLLYTSARAEDEFYTYMGKKNSHEHLIFCKLENDLDGIGKDNFIKKQRQIDFSKGKRKPNKFRDKYCKFREEQEKQGLKARKINDLFYSEHPDCENTTKAFKDWWDWWNKYKTQT